MRALRVLGRWAADWRNITVLVGAALTAYLGVLVVATVVDRQRALDAAVSATASEREARRAAVHRIDQLLAKIDALQRTGMGNSAQLVLLRAEVALLEQQVRDMGGQPVVITAGGGSSPSPAPSSSRSPKPSRTPSPQPTPSHTPTPVPSRTCIAVICLH